jgi:hypothetical protein
MEVCGLRAVKSAVKGRPLEASGVCRIGVATVAGGARTPAPRLGRGLGGPTRRRPSVLQMHA